MRAILLIAVLVPLFSFAQDPDDIRQQQANAANVAAGKTQFQQTCGFCHGPDGRGASGPDLIRSPLVSHDVDGNLGYLNRQNDILCANSHVLHSKMQILFVILTSQPTRPLVRCSFHDIQEALRR